VGGWGTLLGRVGPVASPPWSPVGRGGGRLMLVDLLDQQHSTVITRCLSPVSMAEKGSTSDHWSIYRNLIDLRVPTAGRRPRWVGDTAVWRFGTMFKSNEKTAPDGPYDLFHNTFLVNDQVFEQPAQAAYVHYRSGLSPHRRRSFNNIFVAVNPDPTADIPIAFVPPPSFPGPTDGNLYHRIGDATAPAFSVVDYDLDCVHHPGQTFETLCDLNCPGIDGGLGGWTYATSLGVAS
jgi:hypothetical protein